jgi:hypothetical protein
MSTASLTTPINVTTGITAKGVSGNQINVHFTGLPGNLPNNYGNYLVCWRSQDAIPYNDASPEGFVAIAINKSEGSQELPVLFQVNVGYIIGYAVGPKATATTEQLWKNVCATAYIPPSSSDPNIYFSPTLSKFDYDTDSISMSFQLPSGCSPQSNGAWVGVWQTGVPSYTTPPIASAPITINSSQGAASINGVQVLRDQTYTVALFMSGYKAGGGGTSNVQTAMACSATLNT